MCKTMLRLVIWINVSLSECGRAAGSQRMEPPPPCLPLTPTHPLWLTPSPRPSSSDPSSWHPAPLNSLQHLLGPANHWCSAPSVAATPAPLTGGTVPSGTLWWRIYGEGVGRGGVFLLPKTAQGAAESEKKIKTSVNGVKSCHWWSSCCVKTMGT